MDRRLLALAAALVSAPLPALAQTWPGMAAISAAGTRAATPPPAPAYVAPVFLSAVAPLPENPVPTAATNAEPHPLKLPVHTALNDSRIPTVDIPAKAEWTDDQGLRLDMTMLRYKQRF